MQDRFVLTLQRLNDGHKQISEVNKSHNSLYLKVKKNYKLKNYFELTETILPMFPKLLPLVVWKKYRLRDLQLIRNGTPDFVLDIYEEDTIIKSIFIEFKMKDDKLTYLQSCEFPKLTKDFEVYILNVKEVIEK